MRRNQNTESNGPDQGGNPLDAQIDWTEFYNLSALKAKARTSSLRDIAAEIQEIFADTKRELPLMKLATFGTARTDKGSLRHAANMQRITGIEADYDGEKIIPKEAARRLRKAGIAALVYTSPSHTTEAPRWRVLAPLSEAAPIGMREEYVARVNGVLSGALASESFTIAQSFYFGGLADTVPEIHLVEGDYIDHLNTLESVAVYPVHQRGQDGGWSGESVNTEDALDDIRTGRAYHTSVIRLAGKWAASGVDEGEAVTRLRAAFDGGSLKDTRWHDRVRALKRTVADIYRREAEQDAREGAEIIRLFNEPDPETDALIEESRSKKSGLLTFTAPADLTITTARKPIIKGLVAAGDIGCIVGAPGVGKSLIAPRLAWAVAQGRDVFGLRVRVGGVFYVAAEDEHGMRARMMALRNSLGDAQKLRLVGGVSDLLAKNAPQLKALRAAVKVECPALVVIDTLAMAFPGLEENSAEGMGRVVAAARSLAQWGAAVLLVHHDTKDGQQGLPRGHSLLNGALDVSLHLKRGENGAVRGTLTKNRNGSCDLDIAFRIGVETLGQDEEGEDVRAAMCEPLVITDEVTKPKLTPNERAALAALRDVASGSVASFDEWRDACVKGTEVFASADQKARRARFAECRKGLIQKERIRHDDVVVELLDAALINPNDFEDEADE